MDALRFGIVGLGPRATSGWIPTLRLATQARVVAVCDAHVERLAAGARLAGVRPDAAHRQLDELLDRPDVDAVAIVVATELQADIAVRALEAGKHVICEVPLTYSIEDCWRIVIAAERSGAQFALGEQVSHSPFANAWRDLKLSGDLGHITYAEAQYLHPIHAFWTDAETGAYIDWPHGTPPPTSNAVKTRYWNIYHPIWYNTHSLAPLLRIMDADVTKVTCMATARPGYHKTDVPLPDIEVALMKTNTDAIVRIAVGFVAPSPEPFHWWHVVGTEGEVETDRSSLDELPTGGLMWLHGSNEKTRVQASWDGESLQNKSGHAGSDLLPVDDFVASVLEARAPVVDVYRAANVAAAGAAAGVSAEDDAGPVEVPNFRPGSHRKKGELPT